MSIEKPLMRASEIEEAMAKFNQDEVKRIYAAYPVIKKNYNCALKEVQTKLEVLNEDFELQHKHNPIHTIHGRVKSVDSILEKCARLGYKLEGDAFLDDMMDIGGIRVICHYIDDIYTVANLVKSQPDLTLINEKDYIENPKPNGYRSLHLIVKVPVFFVDCVRELPVEVQIRTMAMDFWASLEHQLRYKSDGVIPGFIARELLDCADTISASDFKMQKIHSFLDLIEDELARL